MTKLKRDEETAMQYLLSLMTIKNWRLSLVILNRHHKKDKYISDFIMVFKDTTGTMHIDTGIRLFGADYIFYLLDLQKRFPDVGLIDLTANKDNPLYKSMHINKLDSINVSDERSIKNDLQTDSKA